jgi:hypothetical protein
MTQSKDTIKRSYKQLSSDLNLPILPCSAGKSYVFVGH